MPAPSRSLKDTVIAVSGAAGGIGQAICLQALEAGARVVATDLNAAALAELSEASGGQLVGVPGDITLEETSAAVVAAAVQNFGQLDSVVANAGIGFYGGLMDYGPEQIALMINVNLLGTIWLSRAATVQFRSAGHGGDIVIMGSVAGMLIGGGKESVYAATKGAQINFGTALDRELRAEGIRTTVIAPAGVNTPFAAADGRFGDIPPEQGPFMEPGDIAGAVMYTLSQPRRMRTELWTMWSLAEKH